MPEKRTLLTWNTQGDFTTLAKSSVIDTLADDRSAICFLQEGGVEKAGSVGRWLAFGGEGVGSKNERCTNYVLVDALRSKFSPPEHVELVDKDDNLLIGGGQAGRTPAAVAVAGILFISWHSVSTKANDDTSNLVAALERNYAHRYPKVIIGGDFNTSPDEIVKLVARGTARTRESWKYKSRRVFRCGNYTHAGDEYRELDFFLALSTSEDETFQFALSDLRATEVHRVAPSDHDPVRVDLWL